MAEQTPGDSFEQGYRPTLTDWRGLIVLAPMADQEMLQVHQDALQQALDTSALSLFGTQVSREDISNTLLIAFYMSDTTAETVIGDGIGSVYQALQESDLADMELVAMQMARQLDVEVFGEEYFGSDDCYVGQPAYDTYQYFTHIHDTLGSME